MHISLKFRFFFLNFKHFSSFFFDKHQILNKLILGKKSITLISFSSLFSYNFWDIWYKNFHFAKNFTINIEK